MDSIIKKIFESVSSGKIDKQTGLEILNTLKQSRTKTSKDIAIIGMSIKLPNADSIEEFYNNIKNKKESIKEFPPNRQKECMGFIRNFTALKENEINFSVGGYLDSINEFDYEFFNLSPKEAQLMDPNQRLFLEACWSAIEDAGYGGKKISGTRTGVYLGFADWPVYGQYIAKRQPSMLAVASAGNTPSIMASRISYLLDLKGPAFLVDTACSSSLVAVHLACNALKNNECEMAIVGGTKVTLMPVNGVFEMGIESSSGKICTFDDSADGTVWGEGVVSLLLKPMDKALKDNDNIYAIIKGSSINQDGTSVGITAPNASAQEDVIVRAWKDAGIDPESITYIEAHGTGTKLGDPIEIDGIQRAFRKYTQKKQFCAISSLKTNIGHLDSASGISGLVKAVVSLKYKELLPTLNFSVPNNNISFVNSPIYVNNKLRQWVTDEVPRRCGVSSFGFSGTNSHVVIEEAPPQDYVIQKEMDEYKILTLSAKNRNVLKELVRKYIDYIEKTDKDLSDICYTANTGRGHYSYRLAIQCLSKQDLLSKLNELYINELSYDSSSEVFIGQHHVVITARKQRKQGEITTDELSVLNESVNSLINDILIQNSKDTQCEILNKYVMGADVNWEVYYSKNKRRKVRIPTYPFQRIECWNNMPFESFNEEQLSDNSTDITVTRNQSMQQSSIEVVLTGRDNNEYSEYEKKIASIWGEMLGHKEISIYDDFFELGGNSILAIRMEVELEKEGIILSSDTVYTNPSIKELSDVLLGRTTETVLIDNKNIVNEQFEPVANTTEVDEVNIEKTIISNVEPFNEVFYKNCFFNSVFPIVHHFGQSIIPFVVNDIVVYEYNDSTTDIGYGISYSSLKPIEDILNEMGIRMETKYQIQDIISEIIDSVSNQKPVVVWVDSFYESIRDDAYLKEHINHTLLIYGYDKIEKLFHIIEHDRQENLSYKKRVISFGDVENAYQGYIENYSEYINLGTLYLFEPLHEDEFKINRLIESNENYASIFAKNIACSTERIENSIKALKSFVDSFRALVDSEENIKKSNQYLVDFCNSVINAKNVERYRLTMLNFEANKSFEMLCEIIKKWEVIRKGLLRYMYLPIYKVQVFISCHEKLVKILEEEELYNKALISELNDLNFNK